ALFWAIRLIPTIIMSKGQYLIVAQKLKYIMSRLCNKRTSPIKTNQMPDVNLFSILCYFLVNLNKMLHKTTSYGFFTKLLLGYVVYTFGEINHSIGEISSTQMCILQ